jgi:hypothetical protein
MQCLSLLAMSFVLCISACVTNHHRDFIQQRMSSMYSEKSMSSIVVYSCQFAKKKRTLRSGNVMYKLRRQ